MEFLYREAMRFRVEDILVKPVNFLPAIMRELDRLPTKITQREAYIGNGDNVEIEAIADAEKLPGRPPTQSTTTSRPTKATSQWKTCQRSKNSQERTHKSASS